MYTQKKPIDNTHIVREKDRQRNRELLAVLFLGVPIGLFLLLFTWQNLEVIRLGREANRLQKPQDGQPPSTSPAGRVDRMTLSDAVERSDGPRSRPDAKKSPVEADSATANATATGAP